MAVTGTWGQWLPCLLVVISHSAHGMGALSGPKQVSSLTWKPSLVAGWQVAPVLISTLSLSRVVLKLSYRSSLSETLARCL